MVNSLTGELVESLTGELVESLTGELVEIAVTAIEGNYSDALDHRVIFLINNCHETKRKEFETEIGGFTKQVFQIANSGLEGILGATARLAEEIRDTQGQFSQTIYSQAKEKIAHARRYADSGSRKLDEHLVTKIDKAEIELHRTTVKKLRLLASGHAVGGNIANSIAYLSEIINIKRVVDNVFKNGVAVKEFVKEVKEVDVESVLTTAYERGIDSLLKDAQSCYRKNPKKARELLGNAAYYTSRKFLKETRQKLFLEGCFRLGFAEKFYPQIGRMREDIRNINQDVRAYERIQDESVIVARPRAPVVAGSKHRQTIVSWGNFAEDRGNN